jgi:hypothetical protein
MKSFLRNQFAIIFAATMIFPAFSFEKTDNAPAGQSAPTNSGHNGAGVGSGIGGASVIKRNFNFNGFGWGHGKTISDATLAKLGMWVTGNMKFRDQSEIEKRMLSIVRQIVHHQAQFKANPDKFLLDTLNNPLFLSTSSIIDSFKHFWNGTSNCTKSIVGTAAGAALVVASSYVGDVVDATTAGNITVSCAAGVLATC